MSRISQYFVAFFHWANNNRRTFLYGFIAVCLLMGLILLIGKTYQHLDKDEHRGGFALENGAFGESYSTPIYLDQGWSRSDSMWFYNTTQGSNLLPYDFFLVLEEAESEALLRSAENIDRFRYLPQKPTFFNPDGLPLGFVKDEYQGMDYVGFTCAACHTGQLNYKGKAVRIDGAPAMADMSGFMAALDDSLTATLNNDDKRARFVDAVLALDSHYRKVEEVEKDLLRWQKIRQQYNIVNHSEVEYGYARLDAFGRIFNRVLQYVINKQQVQRHLLTARLESGDRMLTREEVELVLENIDEAVIGREQFIIIVERLMSDAPGYPNLSLDDVLILRDSIFNEPNAPVSYPFLWDTAHSDFVQWNGIAANAGAGALGRNVGEVMGVFATLDWTAERPWWAKVSISARLSGQENKKHVIDFKSSVDLVNLQRLESQVGRLKSPLWPTEVFGDIDIELAERGQRLYAEYCVSCHEVIDRNDWNRKIIAKMSGVDRVNTDPAMAENSVLYKGSSGNFRYTYQARDVGDIIVEDKAPAAVILSAAARGVIGTPDADKHFIRRRLDWLYLMAMNWFTNDIEPSIRSGDYSPDTTARPFDSLLAYKARPLNGIWATAPYLHNGSVPTLYDLLLPAYREGDPEDGEYRPASFMVGSREFDPEKVGFKSEGYEGFLFDTRMRGNDNSGHEYAAGLTPQIDGRVLPALDRDARLALLEYLKTL